MASNFGWVYVKEPGPVPKSADIFEKRAMDMPEVKEGMVLVKTKLVSFAPHILAFLKLRGNDVGAEDIGLKRLELGDVALTELVAEVIESKSPKYRKGEMVSGFLPVQRYCAFCADGSDGTGGTAPVKLFAGVKPESALSMGGVLTAQIAISGHRCGMVDEPCCEGGCFSFLWRCFSFLRRKAQKTVLVTSAAGTVGLAAGQLYKLRGCKVIGVTSTKQKADKCLEFGYDHVIAYKEEDMDARLGELAPEGIDIFFDNVGARQLDTGTKHMKVGGKILQVGACAEVANYASGDMTGWKQYVRMVSRELQVGGFLLTNHFREIPFAILRIIMLQKSGKLKSEETVMRGGLERFAELNDLVWSGESFGRLVLAIDDAL